MSADHFELRCLVATNLEAIIGSLVSFYKFSEKCVIDVGAGGGQLASWARETKKVKAVDTDPAAIQRLQAEVARIGLTGKFEYFTGDFLSFNEKSDVVLFEFSLHEMRCPDHALTHAKAIADDVVILDHAAGSPWGYLAGEETKISKAWSAILKRSNAKQQTFEAAQSFSTYEELRTKLFPQGEVSLQRIEQYRSQTDILIPMPYTLALL